MNSSIELPVWKINKGVFYLPTVIFLFFISLISFSVEADMVSEKRNGFYVDGASVYDANGQPFLMRGINHPHTWYTGKTYAFKDIAATGANTIRVVLSNGNRWQKNNGEDVSRVIYLCKRYKVVCVLEVHDSTGYSEDRNATHISRAAQYWTSEEIMPALLGSEKYVIINIANEPFGNKVSESDYVQGTVNAIGTLRKAGLEHALMIDAANWGQDWQYFMQKHALNILESDARRNVIFDVHMYEIYSNANRIEAYFKSFVDKGLALVVGEFGSTHNGHQVASKDIMRLASEYGIGYIGWSWSGNGSCCYDLDIVKGFDPNKRTSWGKELLENPFGIEQTSIPASIFTRD